MYPPTRDRIFQRDLWTCCWCGTLLQEGTATVDHLLPQKRKNHAPWRGGVPHHLVTSCAPCNRSRGSLPVAVWLRLLHLHRPRNADKLAALLLRLDRRLLPLPSRRKAPADQT